MFGIWNKNSYLEYEYVDLSVFYFEASFIRQQLVVTNDSSNLITTIDTHPCVPCTKEHFQMNNWPRYYSQGTLK